MVKMLSRYSNVGGPKITQDRFQISRARPSSPKKTIWSQEIATPDQLKQNNIKLKMDDIFPFFHHGFFSLENTLARKLFGIDYEPLTNVHQNFRSNSSGLARLIRPCFL